MKNVSCNDKINYKINAYMRIKKLMKQHSITGIGTTTDLKIIVAVALAPESLIRS